MFEREAIAESLGITVSIFRKYTYQKLSISSKCERLELCRQSLFVRAGAGKLFEHSRASFTAFDFFFN